MGVPGMDTVENKGFSVVEGAKVNGNSALVSISSRRYDTNIEESNVVQILRNKEIETEERLEKSPLHLSLRELSIV